MSDYKGKDEKDYLPEDDALGSHFETGVLNYRRIIPQLVALNARLWIKVEMADQIKVQVAEALYSGRLETIAVEEEPKTRTMKRLRAYVHVRVCLGGLTSSHWAGELKRLDDPSLEPSALFPIMVKMFNSIKDENELLEEVTWEGDKLRSDPLALALWLERAGQDKD